MIRLDVLSKPPVECDDKRFFAVVKAAFSQRRKVISNSLSAGLSMSKEQTLDLLERAGVPANARAEQLSLRQFADIANQL